MLYANRKVSQINGNLGLSFVVKLILALVIFVILLLLLSGKFGFFQSNVFSCESRGGRCVSSASECPGSIAYSYKCESKDMVCCIIDNKL